MQQKPMMNAGWAFAGLFLFVQMTSTQDGISFGTTVPSLPPHEVVYEQQTLDLNVLKNIRFDSYISPIGITKGKITNFDFKGCDSRNCQFEVKFELEDTVKRITLARSKTNSDVFNDMIKRQGLTVAETSCATRWCIAKDLLSTSSTNHQRIKRISGSGGGAFTFHQADISGFVTKDTLDKQIGKVRSHLANEVGEIRDKQKQLKQWLQNRTQQTQRHTDAVFKDMDDKLENFQTKLGNSSRELAKYKKQMDYLQGSIIANQVFNSAEKYYDLVKFYLESFHYKIQLLLHCYNCVANECSGLMEHLSQNDPAIALLIRLKFNFQTLVYFDTKQVQISYLKPEKFSMTHVYATFKPAVLLKSGCKQVGDTYVCSRCYQQPYQKGLSPKNDTTTYIEIANPEVAEACTSTAAPEESMLISTEKGCIRISLSEAGTFQVSDTNETCPSTNYIVPKELLMHPLVSSINVEDHKVQLVDAERLDEPIATYQFDREAFETRSRNLDNLIDTAFNDIQNIIQSKTNAVDSLTQEYITLSAELDAALGMGCISLILILGRYIQIMVMSQYLGFARKFLNRKFRKLYETCFKRCYTKDK